jgi:hypothetical protein
MKPSIIELNPYFVAYSVVFCLLVPVEACWVLLGRVKP